MITVQDILKADVFNNSKVLAGEDGLSREVRTITVSEVPDAAVWLRGKELVCTTAFFISNQVDHQTEWIESLINNGASALVIKASRFLGEVPREIIEVAEKNSFSIISLPHEITWPTVIESFMNFFMNERMKLMELVEEIQRKLINLVLENQSIQIITNTISSMVGNPIILEDAKLQVIAIGNTDAKRRVEEVIIKERIGEEFRKKILKSKFYKNVLKGEVEERLDTMVTTGTDHSVLNIMIPIYSNKSLYGFISLLEENKPHTLVDLIVLKNTITTLSLSLMQQYLNEQTYHKKNLALIEDIINGRVHTQIIYEYNYLNINLSNPMIAMMIEYTGPNKGTKMFTDRLEELVYKTIKKRLRKYFGQVIIGNNDSLFTLLISYSSHQASAATAIIKKEMEEVIKEADASFGQGMFLLGLGGVHPSLKEVSKSYREANDALSIGKRFPWKGPILCFDDIGIYRIFSMIQNTAEIQEFCDDLLKELIKYDHENGNVLQETLHMYLLCDGSIKETANRLFLHPNTVAYRVKKIKQLIKYNLDSPEFKMAYLFALESNTLLKN